MSLSLLYTLDVIHLIVTILSDRPSFEWECNVTGRPIWFCPLKLTFSTCFRVALVIALLLVLIASIVLICKSLWIKMFCSVSAAQCGYVFYVAYALIWTKTAYPHGAADTEQHTLQNGTTVTRRRCGGDELLNKVVIFVFFPYKKYSRSFVKLRLNPWCHMDYFTDLLATFLDVDRGNYIAVYGRVRELSECIKNILICVPKTKLLRVRNDMGVSD